MSLATAPAIASIQDTVWVEVEPLAKPADLNATVAIADSARDGEGDADKDGRGACAFA